MGSGEWPQNWGLPNTIRKYLRESRPRRQQLRQRSRPVWERVEPRLQELLAELEPRTMLKQPLTAARRRQQLISEGYQVSASLLRNYLHERRCQRQEVYIPLIHRPGEEPQVDFFAVVVEVGGQWLKAWEFLLRLMYSGREFTWLYESCDQLVFLDGCVRAFTYLDGVVRRCIYDNLKPAVRRIVGVQRVLSERLLALASHYLFEPDFTRVGLVQEIHLPCTSLHGALRSTYAICLFANLILGDTACGCPDDSAELLRGFEHRQQFTQQCGSRQDAYRQGNLLSEQPQRP